MLTVQADVWGSYLAAHDERKTGLWNFSRIYGRTGVEREVARNPIVTGASSSPHLQRNAACYRIRFENSSSGAVVGRQTIFVPLRLLGLFCRQNERKHENSTTRFWAEFSSHLFTPEELSAREFCLCDFRSDFRIWRTYEAHCWGGFSLMRDTFLSRRWLNVWIFSRQCNGKGSLYRCLELYW